MNNITELIFIVDCSDAMAGKEFETVSSINKLLDSYRNISTTVYVNAVIFSGEASMLHDRVKLGAVRPMTISDIKTGGSAALYDTTMSVINHIRNIHHYIRPEDVPYKTVFHIFSGGLENASVRYGRSAVRNIVEDCKEKYKWEFNFHNENIYIAKRALEAPVKAPTTAYGIDDDDFKKIMEILQNGRFKSKPPVELVVCTAPKRGYYRLSP